MRRAAGILASGWPLAVLALVALFVAWTRPLAAAAANLTPLLFALVFVAAFIGLGAPLIRRLLPDADRTDQILVSSVCGAGMTGALTFFSSLAAFVEPALWAAWTLLGLLLFGWAALRYRTAGSRAERWTHGALGSLAVVILAVNLIQLIPMLVSPVASTDAMEYHLMIPKIILATEQLTVLPSLVESNYPCLASYIYLLVIPLAGDVACKALHFWAGIGLLVAIARLVARVAPKANRLVAPALYVTMPVAVNLFAWAWNDNLFVLCVLLALGQMLDYHDDPGRSGSVRHLVAAGLLLGIAAWTKYTIVMILLGLAPLLLIAIWRWRWRPAHVVALALPIGLISLLVFVKNLVFTGNPFYPFLHSIFPSPFWTDAAAVYFHDALRRWEIPQWTWHTFVTFPIHLVLRPRLIDVHIGILPLAAVFFVFNRGASRSQTFLKVFLLCHLFAWYIIQTETRSLLTFLAVLLALASPGLESAVLNGTGRRRPYLVAIATGALAALGVTVVSSYVLTDPVRYFFRLESRRDFLMREVEAYPVLEWLNTHDEVAGAVLVGLKRPYYAAKPIWFSAFSDPPIAERLTEEGATPAELAARLKTLGATHIVVDQAEYDEDLRRKLYSWSQDRRLVFETMLGEHCTEVKQFGPRRVYLIGR